jgi:uncharacterized SAM-dependent methyltransferase
MNVNNLIFNELIKRGYKSVNSIKVWDLSDSKLWYLTDKQSQGYLDVEKDPVYKQNITDVEISLIKNDLNYFLSQMKAKSYNVIDIGCGNGEKASLFIGEFSKHFSIRYCPIDISSFMVKSASNTIRELNIGDVLELSWNISDFENLDNVTSFFRNSFYKHHLMLFLGNTMGNFAGNNILETIKRSMKKRDFLLIGNGINPKSEDELIKSYNNKAMIDFWIQPLSLIGFKENEVQYKTRFVDSRMELYFKILKPKKITYMDKTIEFNKNDEILIGISYKYTKAKFKKILSQFFKKVRVITNKDETYALAWCIV